MFHERLFVSLIAYADESGTHDATGKQCGSKALVVAGWVAWQDDWEEFCGEWQEVLNCYGVPSLHMRELNDLLRRTDSKCPYYGWPQDKVDKFIGELIPIVRDKVQFGIAGLLSVQDYDKEMPDYLKAEYGHPYVFAFQLFFDELLDALDRKPFARPFPPGEQIALVFDQQEEFENAASRAFHIMKKHKDKDDRMGTIAFADSRRFLPLQAADLLAHRTRKMFTRKLEDRKPINPGSWDDELYAKGNIFSPYYTADTLRALVTRIENKYGKG